MGSPGRRLGGAVFNRRSREPCHASGLAAGGVSAADGGGRTASGAAGRRAAAGSRLSPRLLRFRTEPHFSTHRGAWGAVGAWVFRLGIARGRVAIVAVWARSGAAKGTARFGAGIRRYAPRYQPP